ncbi:hypothetical protein MASR2M15_18050 [Anaerolineales bacterium]
MTNQLNKWQSEFGEAYTERNDIDWQIRLPAWQTMLNKLSLEHVVEIGPNRGHNLRAIHETGVAKGNLIGIEPNKTAIKLARTYYPEISVLEGNAFSLPLVNGYADLTFTVGVLIHISLDDLPRALSEIYRVSNQYILCAEYFAEAETEIEYRGQSDLLWKRNFKEHWLQKYNDLTCISEGYWSQEDGFDRASWWLFQK